MRLITIPISHYCERARWALAWAGLPYKEEQHLQMFSWIAARRTGGGKMLPVLVATGDTVLTDSAEIVRYADGTGTSHQKLYPTDAKARAEVEQCERDHADVLGVASRRVMYDHFFRWGRPVLAYNNGVAPKWQRTTMHLGFSLMSRVARRYLNVNPAAVSAASETVERSFDEVGRRLGDGRPFLFGDTFTAADLTFACMAAAVVSPPQYGIRLPSPAEMPEPTRALVLKFRRHPAGAFALRMFADHRNT